MPIHSNTDRDHVHLFWIKKYYRYFLLTIGFFFILSLWSFYFSGQAHASSFSNCSNFQQFVGIYNNANQNIINVPTGKTYYFYNINIGNNGPWNAGDYVRFAETNLAETFVAEITYYQAPYYSTNNLPIYHKITGTNALHIYSNIASTGSASVTILYTDGECTPITQTTQMSERDIWALTLGLALLVFYATIQIYILFFRLKI